MTSIHNGLDEARRLLRTGAADAAAQICRQVIELNLDIANAWHLLGLCEAQRGRHEQALLHFDRALAIEAGHAGFLLNRGVSQQALGRYAAAAETFRAALTFNPRFPEAFNNLANVLQQTGQSAAAIDAWRQALQLRPQFSDASQNLATVLLAHGRAGEALAITAAAVQGQPNDPSITMTHGDTLVACGRHAEAAAIYRALLQAGVALPGLRTRLAHALRLSGRAEDALAEALLDMQWKHDNPDAHIQASAALGSLGRSAEAEAHIRQALYLRPEDPEACHNLAVLLNGRRQSVEATDLFRRALRGNPNLKEATTALARALSAQGLLDEAEDHLREALRRSPREPTFFAVLGEVLTSQGRVSEGQAAFRESLRLDPAQPAVESSLLFTRLFEPHLSPSELLAAHRDWAQHHAQVTPLPPCDDNRIPDRVLRVGYVSPDLCGHVVAKFFSPVLMHHDRQRIHAICYADIQSPDDVTRRLSRGAAQWRLIRGRDDDAVANLIRADRIDILVDLAGHTGTRLGVFARRPAPVQITWLGYPATTGLPAIQFMLADAWTIPQGQEPVTAEEVLRLPASFCCYSPSADAPPVSMAPSVFLGKITFSSTHKLAKLNDDVLDTWCAALRAAPQSRLLIYRDCLRGRAAADLKRRLLERDLSPERFEFQHATQGSHLAIYAQIDVLLDTWPWSGHATACEALWQGVPTLTLPGPSHASRMVASALRQVGLTDFIASSTDEFIGMAARLAADPAILAERRQNLREQTRRSPLCDARRFTAELEDTYRALWRRRCSAF